MSIPNRLTDDIYQVVQSAIDQGVSPREFIDSARESWAVYLKEKAEADDRAFAKVKP